MVYAYSFNLQPHAQFVNKKKEIPNGISFYSIS